ncbi:MAG: hypothetical protein LBC76_05765 [Treponema sp.]|jgi:hypothetical protein|nr:hypothetical protein [Treponema sp.]
MSGVLIFLTVCLFFTGFSVNAEAFRTVVEGSIEVSPERPAGNSVSIGINSSVIITLGSEARFLRGIEIEITSPQNWLAHRGAVGISVHNNINTQTSHGVTDIDANRTAFDPLPARLQTIYQIPVRQSHGLRTTTTVTVLPAVTQLSAFPILFRMMPVIKGLSDELENMNFNLTVRPIISDEGAVRFVPRYPPQLRNRPFTVLIDDNVIPNTQDQIVLREGEHHLVILSDDYRNESRRFVVERAKVNDLVIELQDPTPILILEAPQNAVIFLDNAIFQRSRESVTVEPGLHEIKFQIGDYTITRNLNVQRGKTYRIALTVDLTVQEEN